MLEITGPFLRVTFAKDQPEYNPLPAVVRKDDPLGETVTHWKFSWRERLRVLFGSRLQLTILTFNGPLQPLRLELVAPAGNDPASTD